MSSTPVSIATADLSDASGNRSHVCQVPFRDFGGKLAWCGRIRTVRCRGDNLLIRRQLEQKVSGDALIVDSEADLGFALLGDNLAAIGAKNGWSGAVIFG